MNAHPGRIEAGFSPEDSAAIYDLDGPINDAKVMSEIAIAIVSRALERGPIGQSSRFDIGPREVDRIIFSVSDVSRRLDEITKAYEKATCAT